MSVTDSVAEFLLRRTSRRGFLAKATVTATALSVAPADLLLKPGTAYSAICECVPGTNCSCGDLCCDGYTQFCCTINSGINACPAGSFPGGWWKADGSAYCAGPRYFIDCQAECKGCGCSGGNFCPSCDGLTCECALGNCANRHVGCTEFRYGQCHPEIPCSGRINCRVVSCTPPWLIDSTCSTVAQTDEATANHYAPCQNGPTKPPTPPPPPPFYVGMTATPTGKGFWIVDRVGGIHPHGDAVSYGSMAGVPLSKPVVAIAATPSGKGYWMAASDGGIFSFGDARFYGSTGAIKLNSPVLGMDSAAPGGPGYRMVAGDGGIFDFGAAFYGSMGGSHLNKPVVGMSTTITGKGYWLVASDGGIFSFGDARFYGSLGDVRLTKPVVGMATTSTGRGYWLVAADGGIFTFGDAYFYGSLGNKTLAATASGMAATVDGKGYWILLGNGQLYPFGSAVDYPVAP